MQDLHESNLLQTTPTANGYFQNTSMIIERLHGDYLNSKDQQLVKESVEFRKALVLPFNSLSPVSLLFSSLFNLFPAAVQHRQHLDQNCRKAGTNQEEIRGENQTIGCPDEPAATMLCQCEAERCSLDKRRGRNQITAREAAMSLDLNGGRTVRAEAALEGRGGGRIE